MTDYGLTDELLQQIKEVFRQHPSVWRVIVFGSRAMNTHRAGSDIDLAVMGNNLTRDELLDLQIQLDELGFLYEFDVKDLTKIRNPELVDHIERVGSVVYDANRD